MQVDAGRHDARRWLAVGSAVAGCIVLGTVATPASAAKRPTANVVVTITTPKGVPANVTVRSRAARRTVAKKPAGRSTRVRFAVRPGRVRVIAPALVFDGVPYRAVVSRAAFTAPRRAKTRVRVRYVRVSAARRLRATRVATDRIALAWTAPRRAAVRLRRTSGERPATTVRGGVNVAIKGRSAVDRGLRPGTTYSYALFTKARGGWVGPVTVVSGTATSDNRMAAYVAPPSTVIVEPGDADEATVVPGGVSVKLAATRATPVIGAGFVLPVSAALPAGFLGTVSSISADGRTVILRAGGIADAFDYYDIHVDLSTVDPIALTPDAEALEPPAGRAARTLGRAARALPGGLGRCRPQGSAQGSVVLHPTVQPSGRFSSSLVKKWGTVPVGAKFDLSAQMKVSLAADIDTAIALTCGLPFRPMVQPIVLAPVPIAIVFDPIAEIGVGGQMSVKNVGYTATGGFWAKGEIGAHNSVDGGLIKEASPTPASGSWSVPLTVSLGGEFTVGPGSGTSAAGAVAGVGGKFVPLKAAFAPVFSDGDPRRGACIKTTVGIESEFNVNAKAWMGSFKISKSLTIDALRSNYDYAGWYLPNDCDKLPPPASPRAPSAPPSNDALGDGVEEITSSTTGSADQWGHVDGFIPGQRAWILGTGKIAEASIADPAFHASTDLGGDGNGALSNLIGGASTYDAASYTLTLKPAGDMLHVRYLFASEEYPEFVGEGYDDVMAVFVNGVNCALVPGTGERVSVDSVNAYRNAQYYVDNESGAAGYQTSMDGLTTPLTCDVPVTPGQPVTVEVAVADSGDHIYDSVVGLIDKGIWSD